MTGVHDTLKILWINGFILTHTTAVASAEGIRGSKRAHEVLIAILFRPRP